MIGPGYHMTICRLWGLDPCPYVFIPRLCICSEIFLRWAEIPTLFTELSTYDLQIHKEYFNTC